jgi:hypothetical protein
MEDTMSRVLWASAAIAIGISLTPSVALAANGSHSRPHSANSRQNNINNDDGAARASVLAIGAGYAYEHGSAAVRSLQRQLVAQGISPGPVDGRYGPMTAAASNKLADWRSTASLVRTPGGCLPAERWLRELDTSNPTDLNGCGRSSVVWPRRDSRRGPSTGGMAR